MKFEKSVWAKSIIKIIKEEDAKGKGINEISDILVYDVQISPELAWKMIKKTLGLKAKKFEKRVGKVI
jgi:hypothetical protein